MEKRIDIVKTDPAAYTGMRELEKYIHGSELTKVHLELIKIRASQINNCAYCINMHTRDALKIGESQQRIFLLQSWKETDLYSEEEKVILSMTEEITMIHQQGLTSETYHKAENLFSPRYLAAIIMAIVTINSWNRLAISTLKHLD